MRGAEEADTDRARQRAVVDAFLAAAREGDLDGLLDVLDPDVMARGEAWVTAGASAVTAGASGYAHLARVARAAVVDGATGLVVLADGRVERALSFTVVHDRIVVIDIATDPDRLAAMDVELL
ncbi:hypothetical protein ACIBBD_26875 [Streptomyces sp. NPDC051315]|uniref:hypothetical protein n=1 Tax=Streptomyces sp. NPDC051315 TaxID=3365650 RepID=UPI00379D46C2